ncbi:MAG: HlyD family efflux transporter periplasmic adaptor subunit [Tannerellaceae bacterium]|jgi:HlyD family secretion protein|nr:HlyD family efflux transporter periplasmic adaptor subunit [Tannerellaceae bacterium]
MKTYTFPVIILFLFIMLFPSTSCRDSKLKTDAAGIFEATETIISSEVSGMIKRLDIQEGDRLEAGKEVALIDTPQLHLRKLQLLSRKQSLHAGRPDMEKQLASIREEIARYKKETVRTENLFQGGAATRQQLDEITAQFKIAEGRLMAQQNSLQMTIETIDKESEGTDIQIAQIEDQLVKCRIINPVQGRVLKKYAEAYEIVAPAKALYRIADTEKMFLRAYITSDQLLDVKLGQQVKVYSDHDESEKREYNGRIVWISDKAEFTPKTIQTKDERANLVYAIKIAVHNDGYLKIGQYGELVLSL